MTQSTIAIKNTLFLFIRVVFTTLISLYTSRIILQALGASDYGLYNIIGGMVALISFLHYSLNGATLRFMNLALAEGDITVMRMIFNTVLKIHFVIAILIFLICETGGLWFLYTRLNIPPGRENAAFWIFQLSIISMMLNVVQVPYDSAIIAHQRMKVFAIISFIEAVLKLVSAYLLFYTLFDKLIAYSLYILICSVIIRLTYQIYCRRNFAECKFDMSFDKNIFKEISVFFGWDLVGNVSSLLRTQGINILQNMFFGTIVNAAMGLASTVSGAINGVVSNINLALKPQIFQYFYKKDYKNVVLLISRGTKLSFFLLLLICVPIFFETKFILNLWLVSIPNYTINFIKLFLISLLVGVLFDFLTVLLNATGKIKLLSISSSIIYTSSVALSYVLLKNGYDVYTTTIMHILSTFAMGLAILLIIIKIVPDFPFYTFLKEVILKNLFILGIVAFGIFSFSFLHFNNAFLRIVMDICFTGIVIYIFGLTAEERAYAVSQIKKII